MTLVWIPDQVRNDGTQRSFGAPSVGRSDDSFNTFPLALIAPGDYGRFEVSYITAKGFLSRRSSQQRGLPSSGPFVNMFFINRI